MYSPHFSHFSYSPEPLQTKVENLPLNMYSPHFRKRGCNMDSNLISLVAMVTVAIYFVPTIIAATRKHQNSVQIFLLNIFLGWTFLGWVAALIWSTTKVDNPKTET